MTNRMINKWNLFWLISAPMSFIIAAVMFQHDMSDPNDVSEMIGFSVRWAVPLIFIVTAASAAKTLHSNAFTLWWFRNRKYIGLCFAVAMMWQGSFIFFMSFMYRDYYFEDVYLLRNEIEGSIGYIFLLAMIVTSFKTGSKYLNPQQWKLVHKIAVYFLWAYAFTVYWWNLYYYPNPVMSDHLLHWMGFFAFASRIAAWGKKRHKTITTKINSLNLITGGTFVTLGLAVAASGLYWRESVNLYLLGPAWSSELYLWLPYWPFEPFFSFFMIGIGVMIMTPTKNVTFAN